MGETTNEIKTHIENKRQDLGSNLQELEEKVKSVTDWRQQFQSNTMLMIGAAFGGGVLLGTMTGGRTQRRYAEVSPSESKGPTSAPHAGTDHQKQRVLETWDNIKGALIGVAASQIKSFLGEMVPGFHEEFKKTEDRTLSSLPAMSPKAEGIK